MTSTPHRVLPFVTAALSVLVICAFALSAWSFKNGHRNACKSRDVTLDVVAGILTTAREQGEQPESARTKAFYDAAAVRISAARC